MKKLSLIPFVCLLWIATSCERKQLPEPVIEEPDFQLSGTLDGNAFSMIAGENNMQANAHVFQDAFGIYHYGALLEPFNCADCNGSLGIHLTSEVDYATGELPSADADLFVRDVELLTAQAPQNYMEVEMTVTGLVPGSFIWILEDGNVTSMDLTVEHQFSAPGPQEVILQINDLGSCFGLITQTINAGSPELCSLPFQVFDLGGGLVQCIITDAMPEGLQLQGWSVDGDFLPVTETTIEDTVTLDDTHVFEAYFMNAQGIPGIYSVVVNTPFLPLCFGGITWNYITSAPETGKVAITYQSPQGINYTSAFEGNTNPVSHFQIVEVADYDLQIGGLPTRRVRVEFSVFLVNLNDPLDVLWMENVAGEMVFVLPD